MEEKFKPSKDVVQLQ